MLPATVLTSWVHTSRGGTSQVMPDGCRDLIVVHPRGGEPRWLVTGLDAGPRRIDAGAGDRFTGLRLHPGTRIDEPALGRALRGVRLDDFDDVAGIVGEVTSRCEVVVDALEALAEPVSMTALARRTGTGERSLQRLLRRSTGWTPVRWRRLARVRRALTPVAAGGAPLADVAVDTGFSDQAHLTRELNAWFGLTPARLRANPQAWPQLGATGYGGQLAIGVHNSMQNPSGSLT